LLGEVFSLSKESSSQVSLPKDLEVKVTAAAKAERRPMASMIVALSDDGH
jgi:hypothetical protein